MAVETVSITAGTTDPIAVDDVGGTLKFQQIKVNLGADGAVGNIWDGKIQGGTIDVGTVAITGNLAGLSSGTINSIPNTPGGTLGLITRVSTVGTLEVGTISALPNTPGGTLGLVTRVGNIGTLEVGTVTIGNVNSIGTLGTLQLGTVTVTNPTGTTVQFNNGTIDLLKAGTITTLPNTPGGTLGLVSTVTTVSNVSNGSIKITAGTVGGAGATAVALSGNPVPVAGVDAGGTIYGLAVDAKGQQLVGGGTISMINAGTITSSGTTTGVGVVSSLSAGTITKVEGGTIGLITRVSTIGTLEVGTVTIGAVNSIGTLGTLQLGTVTVTNPTGTTVQFNNGTINVIPNIPGGTLGLVTTVSNLTNGSIAVTAGTITNLLKAEDAGHAGGDSGVMAMGVRVDGGTSLVGTDLDYGPLMLDANGALRISGTVATGAGTQATRIIDGTVTNVGTVVGVGVLTTVTNLSQGSINVTAGTITAGSIRVVAGTVGGAAATAVALSGNPIPIGGVDSGGTVYGLAVDVKGQQLIGGGTIAMLNAGTITTIPNTPGGTLGLVTSVTEVANLAKGTITKIEGGTLALVTTVTNLSNGTIQSSGTTTGVGVVSMLSAGTVSMINAGTITSSGTTTGVGVVSMLSAGTVSMLNAGTLTTIPNIPGGTIGILTNGTLSSSGTTTGVGVVSMLSAGTVSMINAGTLTSLGTVPGVGVVTSVTNLVGGTLGILTNGTLSSSGTTTGVGVVTSVTNLAAGTVQSNPKPTIITNSFGTTTAGTIGTLVVAPSAGSAIFITSLDISAVSGTAEVVVSYGLAATGNQVVNRGLYPVGGGIAKTYAVPNSGSATGTALTYNILSGSGTLAYSLAYFVAVP